MLYTLSREDKSVAEWSKMVGPLIQEAKDYPAKSLGTFLSVWSKAVSFIGESELYARQAERDEIFGIDQSASQHAWTLFKERNSIGVEALDKSRAHLKELQKELEQMQGNLKKTGKSFSKELNEFRKDFYHTLSRIEMKKSDAEQIKELTEEAVSITSEKGLSGLVKFMDAQLGKCVKMRQQQDRGAHTNFAFWKLAAVIAILIVLGIAFWIHCGWFSCSAYSRNNYIAAILVTAGLFWC